MKKVVFLADAHIGSTEEAGEELVGYLRGHLGGAVALYLMGDVFNYAVGLPSFRTPAIDRVVGFLGGLLHDGLAVGYVAGNRDYFASRMLAGHPGIAVTEAGIDVEHFGIPLHLAHGDTVNPDDRQYLRWRRFSRSTPVRLAVGALPAAIAHRLGDRLERQLRSTNLSMKIRFPEAHVAAYGRAALARGRSLVLLGHFHQARVMPVEAGGREGRLYVLPDWLGTRSHAELHEDGRFVLDVAASSP